MATSIAKRALDVTLAPAHSRTGDILNYFSEKDFQVSNFEVQSKLASKLRKLACDNLADGKGVVAKGFRNEYDKLENGKKHVAHIANQRLGGTWGTDIEAASLGEVLGVNIVVTSSIEGKTSKPYCIYRSETPNAPTFHLENFNVCHWSAHGHTTAGAGNCLFNAIAQCAQEVVLKNNPSLQVPVKQIPLEKPVRQTLSVPSVNNNISSFFADNAHAERAAVANQESILQQAVQKAPTPSQLEAVMKNEAERIGKLSPEERKQIEDDHYIALLLASGRSDEEVFGNTKSSVPSLKPF